MALSLTDNTPNAAPICVGENVTLMVQVELPLRVDPQVVDATAKGPVVVMLMPVSVELWSFLGNLGNTGRRGCRSAPRT